MVANLKKCKWFLICLCSSHFCLNTKDLRGLVLFSLNFPSLVTPYTLKDCLCVHFHWMRDLNWSTENYVSGKWKWVVGFLLPMPLAVRMNMHCFLFHTLKTGSDLLALNLWNHVMSYVICIIKIRTRFISALYSIKQFIVVQNIISIFKVNSVFYWVQSIYMLWYTNILNNGIFLNKMSFLRKGQW